MLSISLFPSSGFLFLLRSCLVVITHADRIKTSRTNAEQNKSCDVGREKRKGEGLKDKELITEGPRERWEGLCVEVIHRPGKTGGCYKGKNKRATVIIQIFVRSEVKAECVWVLLYDWPSGSHYMYHRQQLGLCFKLSCIHPPCTPSRGPLFCQSIITRPAIYQLIDKKCHKTPMPDIVLFLHPFIVAAVHPLASFIHIWRR